MSRGQVTLALMLGLLWPARTSADTCHSGWSLVWENDGHLWALKKQTTDHYYTNGLRLSVSWTDTSSGGNGCAPGVVNAISPRKPAAWLARHSGWLRPGPTTDLVLDSGFLVGQNMYTPTDLSRPTLNPDERPYGAWLYGGFNAAARPRRSPQFVYYTEWDLGVVGPLAGGRATQSFVHRIFDKFGAHAERHPSWNHQIKNEPALVGRVRLSRRLVDWAATSPNTKWGRRLDLIGTADLVAGNVFDYGQGAATFRIGYNLDNELGGDRTIPKIVNALTAGLLDLAPPVASPAKSPGGFALLPPSGRRDFTAAKDCCELYAFGHAENRGVLRNLFLDGNTYATYYDGVRFRDAYLIRKKGSVYELEIGAALRIKRVKITWRRVWQEPDFVPTRHGASAPATFVYGSWNISYAQR
jgi:lipid A 3-O-deacylase